MFKWNSISDQIQPESESAGRAQARVLPTNLWQLILPSFCVLGQDLNWSSFAVHRDEHRFADEVLAGLTVDGDALDRRVLRQAIRDIARWFDRRFDHALPGTRMHVEADRSEMRRRVLDPDALVVFEPGPGNAAKQMQRSTPFRQERAADQHAYLVVTLRVVPTVRRWDLPMFEGSVSFG